MSLTILPGSPGISIGNLLAQKFLEEALATSSGFLLLNYHFGWAASLIAYDLILINEQGVWVLEIWHWAGQITVGPETWFHNGQAYPSPLGLVQQKATQVEAHLQELGLVQIPVTGLVLLPRAQLKPVDALPQRVFLLNSALIATLTQPSSTIKLRFSRSLQQWFAEALTNQRQDPSPQLVDNYHLLRELVPKAIWPTYEAQNVRFEYRRAWLKRYQLLGFQATAALEAAQQQFQVAMEPVLQLQAHPNLVRIYGFWLQPEEKGVTWLGLEWLEGQTLATYLTRPHPFTFSEQCQILHPLASALAYCHRQGLLHGQLNPWSVFLVDDGRIKLRNFEQARLPPLSKKLAQPNHPAAVSFVAPEALSQPLAADERSDLYALGMIWYALLCQALLPTPVDLARVAQAAIPTQAKDLLTRLLAFAPNERPCRAQEVTAWLDQC